MQCSVSYLYVNSYRCDMDQQIEIEPDLSEVQLVAQQTYGQACLYLLQIEYFCREHDTVPNRNARLRAKRALREAKLSCERLGVEIIDPTKLCFLCKQTIHVDK